MVELKSQNARILKRGLIDYYANKMVEAERSGCPKKIELYRAEFKRDLLKLVKKDREIYARGAEII